jgi:hypothetical protein
MTVESKWYEPWRHLLPTAGKAVQGDLGRGDKGLFLAALLPVPRSS